MESKAKKFFHNISWLMGGKIVNMLLQFFVSLATTRYLGPANFGTINYVAAYVSFFSSIASLGLAVVVIKEIATDKGDANELLWTSVWMRLATAVLSAVCIVALMFVVEEGDPTIITIAALESVSILFSSFDTINYYFQAKLLAKWSSIAGVLAYIGMSAYRIVLLIQNAEMVWFALATSADMVFLALFLMAFYIKNEGFHPRFRWKTGKYLLKQSYPYMIAGLIMILHTEIDKVMLGKMMTAEAVGYYSTAATASGLWGMIPIALIQSLSPILYDAAKTDRKLYLRRLRQSYAMLFWLNICFSLVICIFARWVILLLYGEEYLPSAAALRITAWYYGISTMTNLMQIYLTNDNKSRYINRFCVAGLVINALLNLLMIPRLGIVGAAIATLVTHIATQIVMPYLYRDTREITHCIVEGALLRDVLNREEAAWLLGGARKLLKKRDG